MSNRKEQLEPVSCGDFNSQHNLVDRAGDLGYQYDQTANKSKKESARWIALSYIYPFISADFRTASNNQRDS
jgi:hypothetical protein